MKSTSTLLMVLLLATPVWLLAQPSMRAGLWENTVTSNGQTVTHNACITAQQEQASKGSVAVMRESIEKALGKNGACKLTEFTVVGNTVTNVMVCGNSTIKNSTVFRGDSFETTVTRTTGQDVKSSLMKGRRIGDCPAGGAK
jgi:Protein of unknown function (DUF3617)